ncbi:MAG TPA: FtsK/SpoIIIE domain-containing protein [Acidimicrobiales bacterium]|nr:FtsK/SpoIIIE domain-containing protein [Acidimicrobiales bacterium]
MLVPFTLVRPDGERIDLQADIDGPVRLGDILDSAQVALPFAGAPVRVDGRLAHVDDLVEHSGLRPGSVLSLAPTSVDSDGLASDPASGLHLAVTAGPCGGLVAPLPPGPSVVGRAPECDIRIPDPTVSNRHFRVDLGFDGTLTVEDLGSRNGVGIDGEALSGSARLRPGQAIVAGDTVLEVREGTAPDAVVHSVAGARELRRPPRLLAAPTRSEVQWPHDPPDRHGPVIPLASAILPLVLGLVMFVATGQILMLLFLLMTPVLVIGNFLTEKRSGRKQSRQAAAAHADEVARAEAELAGLQSAEKAARAAEHPDPATLLATVTGPRRRLWERRPADPDFLEVRIGTATLPSRVRLTSSDPLANDEKEAPPVEGVPCAFSLSQAGVIGVSGPAGVRDRVATWLVAQQAVLLGPADLELFVLAEARSGGADRWSWARWLPHVSGAGGRVAGTRGGESYIDERARALVELVETRWRSKEQARGGFGGAGAPEEQWTWVLVVLDPAHDIRRVAGMELVLQRGPAVRVVAICVEEAESHLPPECQAVVTVAEDGTATLKQSGLPAVDGIRADQVPAAWCETVGRRLASLRDPEVRSAAGHIPGSARLVDVLGLDPVTPQALAARWARQERSTSAVVGIGAEGPFSLDLKADGPHGLVAGTTGAGKSEFLQTLVASLAVANRPDSMNFLLVDYKGGSAFRDCGRLPHTVGVVTDLDGHLVERALLSLGAELKRREELLSRAAAKDIDDYVSVGQPLGPLPRLLIVIDEFAGLVTELPDFVTGLVGIAQRGRSLGIHLILATQRPSGVVSPEIRANTNLRVALRVVSPAESVDIIDAPDAARIPPTTPGRALALTGHSTLITFQAGRVGGPAVAGGGRPAQVGVAPLTWSTAGRRLALRPVTGGAVDEWVDPTDTDLSRLATALVDAASLSRVGAQPQPWLPPLPEQLPLDELERFPGEPAAGRVGAVPLGLVDLPGVQRQEPWSYDPVTARHLLVAGTPGSGRTTVLRTIAASLAGHLSPEDLWLYAIDCGGGELRRLADLPHCGAVVTRTEPDRTDRLLGRLRQETSRRLDLLARRGYADLAEYRQADPAGAALAYIVVLIDRWEGFLSAFDPIDAGRLTEAVLDLAREGASVGIRLVVTGDRQVLLGKLSGMVEDRVCLNLADVGDYSMAGLDPRRVPPVMAPGRAMRSGDQAEMQVAVAGRSASGAAQTTALAELASRWRDRDERRGDSRPFRIDPLPDKIDLQEALRLGPEPAGGPHWALVGVGGDELAPIGLDLLEPGGFVVAGPRRSGRSTALMVMARSLMAGGSAVLAFCPRLSPLRRLEGQPGVVGVVNGDDPSVAETLELVNRVDGPLAVVVDDAPMLHNGDLAELLEAIARDGREQGHVMIVAGGAEDLARPMRGFIVEVRQSRAGLLLCPESHLHGELVGVRLPRSSVFSRPAGRGVLVIDDRITTVQVPWPG